MIAETISHYRILQKLGAGGMGEVYLAEDTQLGRKVAIKFLPAELIADEQAKKRLLREARAAATLDHPNICAVYEVGEESGRSFIVMQFVEGETLAATIKRQPLEVQAVLAVAIQVAEALAEAHARGVIHRDIKPQNIMLTMRGQVKVLDFGLAKVMRESAVAESEAETASRLTASGAIVGTVLYMSPEQVRGEELDGRSDIFSFGVVLYEMVSGQPPFVAPSAAEIFSAILTREPLPLQRYTADLPAELERIVRKCLAKERERRYQAIREVMIDLENVRREREHRPASASSDAKVAEMVPAAAEAHGDKWRGWLASRVGLGVIILALLMLATLAYALLWRRAPTTQTEIKSLVVLPLKNQSGDAQDDFLSDGITDELTTKLTKLKTIRVVSHSIAMRFKNSAKDAAEIGRELAVEAVLDGTMRRSGTRFRVSMHLVNAKDGFEIWADDDFEINLSDLLDTQRHLAEAVAAKLKRQLTSQDRALLVKDNTANAQAYELLLRGKERFSKGEMEVAREMFRQAIRLDPNFADAYAWLSLGLNEQYHSGQGDRATLDAAIANANKALAIDPNLIMARRALITLYRNISQTEEGLKQARLALATNPDDLDAVVAAGNAYFETGILERAIQLRQKAITLDPSAVDLRSSLARCYLYTGEYQKGLDALAPELAPQQSNYWISMAMQLYGKLQQFNRAIEMGQRLIEKDRDGTGFVDYLSFGRILKQAGQTSQARAAWLEGARRGEAQLAAIENVRNRIWLGDLYAELEERDQALAQVKRANTIEPNNAWVLYFSGVINARLGNKREAVAYLKQAVAQGFRELQYFQDLDDKLGDDPAYRAVRDGLQKRVDELRRQY